MYMYEPLHSTHHRVSFRGGRGAGGGISPPLEFEKAKRLDMFSTSVKPQETLVVSVGKHDITNSKNRHLSADLYSC